MTFGKRLAGAVFALGLLVFCAPAETARADLLYQFSLSASEGIEASSFSFIVPTFVTAGESPAFNPFTLTDGTHTWTFVEDLAASSGGLTCFLFGTGGTSRLLPTCGVGVDSPPDAAFALELLFLPITTGVQSLLGFGIFDFAGGQHNPAFAGTLTVTGSVSVPEPSPLICFLAVGGLLFGGKLLKGFRPTPTQW